MIYAITWTTVVQGNVNLMASYKDTAYDHYPEYAWVKEIRHLVGKPEINNIRRADLLADFIKEGKEDAYVFILVNNQLDSFAKWMKEHKMEEYEIYRMERPVTNGNHDYAGRNLNLIILAGSEHMSRQLIEME